MSKTLLALALTILALPALVACGGGGDGPGEAVRAAYTAANETNYDEANTYLDSRYEATLLCRRSDGSLIPRDIWNAETRAGRLESVEILDTRADEVRATVRFRMDYEEGAEQARDEDRFTLDNVYYWFWRDDGGQSRENVAELVRENGGWKLAPRCGV